MGQLAIMICSAATVEESFLLLNRYMYVHAPGGISRPAVEGGHAYLSYRMSSPQAAFSRQGNEYAMAYGLRLIRVIAGDDFRPDFVMVSSSKPKPSTNQLENEFGCPVHYDQDNSAIAFAPQLLRQRPRGRDPEKLLFIKTMLDAIAPPTEGETIGAVRNLIVDLLPLGECNLSMVAKQLGLHPRTLQTRLMKIGLEFRDLVKQARADLAASCLSYTAAPIADIALLLGYSDQATFTRAFSTWRGVSPRRYRLACAA